MRPALRHAEHDCKIVVVKVVPEGQLDDLTLTGSQRGQDGVDQTPEFGLPLVTVDMARTVSPLVNQAERRNRVGQLADHPELHCGIGQLITRLGRPSDRPELHRGIGQLITRLGRPSDRPELHRGIGQLITRLGRPSDRPELHRGIGQLITRVRQLIGRSGRLADCIGSPVAGRRRGPDSASTFIPSQCEQPRTQL